MHKIHRHKKSVRGYFSHDITAVLKFLIKFVNLVNYYYKVNAIESRPIILYVVQSAFFNISCHFPNHVLFY